MSVYDIQIIKSKLEKAKVFSDHFAHLAWFWDSCDLDDSDWAIIKKAHNLCQEDNSLANYNAFRVLLEKAQNNTENKDFKEMLTQFLKYV